MTTPQNATRIGFLGFGEAAPAIAEGLAEAGLGGMSAFDIAFDDAPDVFEARAARSGTRLVDSPRALAESSDLILSLVTCADAVAAAESIAGSLGAHHVYCDHNSVSPQVKQQVAAVVDGAGARFVEISMMDAVPPHRHRVPMLACGAAAGAVAEALAPWGVRIEVLGETIGAAAAAKMFRSIMVKGMQGLFIECLLAAHRYGVESTIFATLNESFPGIDWNALAGYQIGRSALHAGRQSHEMEEVAETLRALGERPLMAEATARRLADFAALGTKAHFGDTAPTDYAAVYPFIEGRET